MPLRLPSLPLLSSGAVSQLAAKSTQCRAVSSGAAQRKTFSPAMERKYRQEQKKARQIQNLQQEHAVLEKGRVFERYQTRDWKAGDVYAPHDLSPSEMKKWRKIKTPATDAFDALKINPIDQYKNFSIMSEYMTEMGRIRHSAETGLRPVNQRKIAKAIRRAIGLGLMPSVHRHPEILIAHARTMINRGFQP